MGIQTPEERNCATASTLSFYYSITSFPVHISFPVVTVTVLLPAGSRSFDGMKARTLISFPLVLRNSGMIALMPAIFTVLSVVQLEPTPVSVIILIRGRNEAGANRGR